MNIRHLITRKIESIKHRLAELASADVGTEGSRSAKQSELAQERGNLAQELRHATKKAEKPDYERIAQVRERQQRYAEIEIAERTSQALGFADSLEKQGEYRQARVWREHALAIPEDVYREHHLIR